MHSRTQAAHWTSIVLLFLGVLLPEPMRGGLMAQASLPFPPGERLEFRLQVRGLGTVGTGTMSVSGPVDVRGQPALLLESEIRARFAIVGGRDRTLSWIDPVTMATLRFEKSEQTPVTRREQAIEVYPTEARWAAEDGRSGQTTTDLPLDELSFIYFIRTLPLLDGDLYRLDRHFDAARNPVIVTVRNRERIEVGAGTFDAVVVEMRVRDPGRYRGEGIIQIHLTDNGCKLPLRIQSTVPGIGTTILTLESHTHPPRHFTAH